MHYRIVALGAVSLALVVLAAGPRTKDPKVVLDLLYRSVSIQVGHVAALPPGDRDAIVCTALAIDREARGEPERGRLAVGAVVRNRMAERGLGACAVVFQPWQFSWTSDPLGKIIPRDVGSFQRALGEAYRVLVDGEMKGFTSNQFVNTSVVVPKWLKECMQRERIGQHVFCRMGGKRWN